ncbi:MAG TPA: FAD-dependent oxidoreductase [Solirubrobacteraceae bacterium]|nr:FAD-dependent oxidoreductase [Solirubrobacteraceae bacterium]
MTSADVAVLGAGPAGLMAARRLAANGRSVVLVERAPVVGGMAGSFEIAGVRVDFGSHRLHPVAAPALLDDLRAVLGPDLQTRVRNGRIALADRWLRFPLRLGDLVRNLPRPFLARVAFDTVTGPLRRRDGANAREVIEARLGRTVAENFYTPYIQKLWGMDAAELSPELADRRVSARSGLAVVKKALRTRRGTEGAGTFLYPVRGFGQISEALAAAAADAGADIRLDTAVAGLDLRDDGEFEVGTVLSTIPVGLLARLADAPAEVVAAAADLRYRAMVLVYLVLDRDRRTAFDAHYCPELRTPVSRLSEPKNFRDGPDPQDVTVVCAELPCWEGDATWAADEDDLAAQVMATLEPLGFAWPALVGVEVRRIARCYPVYSGGYEASLDTLEGWAQAQPRLLTLGRQGLYAPDNTHHVLEMGSQAAAVVRPDGSVDRAAWTAMREAFRSHVVED